MITISLRYSDTSGPDIKLGLLCCSNVKMVQKDKGEFFSRWRTLEPNVDLDATLEMLAPGNDGQYASPRMVKVW